VRSNVENFIGTNSLIQTMSTEENSVRMSKCKFQVEGSRLRSKNLLLNERYSVIECGLQIEKLEQLGESVRGSLCEPDICPIYQTWKILSASKNK